MPTRNTRHSTRSSGSILRLLTKAITFFVAITVGIILISMTRKRDKDKDHRKLIEQGNTEDPSSRRKLSALLNPTKQPGETDYPHVTETSPIRPLTAPVCINNYTTNVQATTATGLLNGNLVNIYRVDNPDRPRIYGRFFTENGTVIGNEFLIPSNITEGPISMKALASGNSLLLYFKDRPYPSFLHGEIVSNTGKLMRGPFIVATNTDDADDSSKKAAIGSFPNGDSLVAWHKKSSEADIINGQFFAADYSKQGAEFTVAGSYSWLSNPGIVTLLNDRYLIYYGLYGASSYSVIGEFYDTDRSKIKSITLGNALSEIMYDITNLFDSSFVFVWTEIPTAAQQYKIYAQRYDSNAIATASPFLVDDIPYCGLRSLLSTTISNRNFLVVWSPEDEEYGNTVFAQYFSADGTRIFGKTTLISAPTNPKNSLVTTSIATNKFVLAWSEQANEMSDQPTVWDQFFVAGKVAPEIQKNTLAINGKGSKTQITANNIFILDPDGLADAIIINVTSLTHGYFKNCHNGNSITEFLQSMIAQGNLCFVQDGTNYPPTVSITGTDPDGFTDGPQKTAVTFINPNNPPEIVNPIPNILGKVEEETVVDVTNTFSYDGTFILSLSRADGKELDPWIKLLFYIATGKSEIRLTPAPGANTATYYLAATETDRVREPNKTSNTAFQLNMDSAHEKDASDGKPLWEILLPSIMTPVGLTGTFFLCSSSLLSSLFFTNLCFAMRQGYSSRKAKRTARRDDYLAYRVFRRIGAPYDCADFKGENGRQFGELIRRFIEKAGQNLPDEIQTTKIKVIAQNVGDAINTVLSRHGYHRLLRQIIGFHISLLFCGLIHPGSTPAYLLKYEDEIVDELRAKYSSMELINIPNSATGITARLLEGAAIDGDMRATLPAENGPARPVFFINISGPDALKRIAGLATEINHVRFIDELPQSDAPPEILELNPAPPS